MAQALHLGMVRATTAALLTPLSTICASAAGSAPVLETALILRARPTPTVQAHSPPGDLHQRTPSRLILLLVAQGPLFGWCGVVDLPGEHVVRGQDDILLGEELSKVLVTLAPEPCFQSLVVEDFE